MVSAAGRHAGEIGTGAQRFFVTFVLRLSKHVAWCGTACLLAVDAADTVNKSGGGGVYRLPLTASFGD